MNISLTPQLELIVKKQVESGLYTNTSEFIRDAIRELLRKNQKDILRMKLQEAMQQIEEGKISNKSAQDIKRLARKRAGL